MGSKSLWVGVDLLQGTQQATDLLWSCPSQGVSLEQEILCRVSVHISIRKQILLSSNWCWRQGSAGQLRMRHVMDSAVQYSRGKDEFLLSLLVVCFSPRTSTGSPHHLSYRFSFRFCIMSSSKSKKTS